MCWTEQQHRLVRQTGGCFRRVGALVCDNYADGAAGSCQLLYTFGGDKQDYIAEDTFAHSRWVPSLKNCQQSSSPGLILYCCIAAHHRRRVWTRILPFIDSWMWPVDKQFYFINW